MAAISPEIQIFMATGSMLPELRNNLAADALKAKADWLLWLDADHTFPDDALLRLLSHNLPIVGCNYARRTQPALPVAVKGGDNLFTTEAKAKAGAVEEADALGLGLCLMNRSAFDGLEQPYFSFEPIAGKASFVAEDMAFFRKIKIKPHVDHALSWAVGHISETTLTNAGTGRRYVNTVLPASGAG